MNNNTECRKLGDERFLRIYRMADDASVERAEREEEERKKREKRARIERAYTSGKAGISRRFLDKSLKDFRAETEEEKNALKAVESFIRAPKDEILLICGGFGTGKTLLSSAIVREIGGFYTPSFRLWLEYKTGADFTAKRNRLDVFNFYLEQSFLVIDEIGVTEREGEESELIANLVSMRYEDKKPTCLVSNLSKVAVVEFLGNRVLDRLNEVCVFIELTGKSKRVRF